MDAPEHDDNDPWLTIAEIADELRVNPATVRLWVSKGALPAKRAGMRKLLVRRSDLDYLLRERTHRHAARQLRALETEAVRPAEFGAIVRLGTGAASEPHPKHDSIMSALRAIGEADDDLAAARDASENAPPDAGFPHRIRELALAFSQQGERLAAAANIDGLNWTAAPQGQRLAISHELRPGANRPGPPYLWDSFDRAVEKVAIARQGTDLRAVGAASSQLAFVMHRIVDALLEDSSQGLR